jgi:hypothetical protein
MKITYKISVRKPERSDHLGDKGMDERKKERGC